MSNMCSSILNNCVKFTQARLPQACLLCGARAEGALLCAACDGDLPRHAAACCPRCAMPSHGGAVCGACMKRPPAFGHARAIYTYAFPLDALVRHCKYGHETGVTAFFADSLAAGLDARGEVDLLLPMPLHPKRLAQRGFNQAAEITRRLAPALGLPWRANACRRTRDTPSQAGLDLDARRRNLRGVFSCDLDLAGKRVALVDDVMTSGSSLDELARAVRRAGATEVHAWVVARAV